MQEKKGRWARWLCVLVLGVGLVLANLPGGENKPAEESEGLKIPGLFASENGSYKAQVEEIVHQVVGAEVEPRILVFVESFHKTDETVRHLPAACEKSIRVKTGRQHKLEKMAKDGKISNPLSAVMSSGGTSASTNDYHNETTVEKWEVVSDTERTHRSKTVVEGIRVVIWTSRELSLAEQAKIAELSEYGLRMERGRGDSIRFEVRKK